MESLRPLLLWIKQISTHVWSIKDLLSIYFHSSTVGEQIAFNRPTSFADELCGQGENISVEAIRGIFIAIFFPRSSSCHPSWRFQIIILKTG